MNYNFNRQKSKPFDWKLLAESIAIGIRLVLIDGKVLSPAVCEAITPVEEATTGVDTRLVTGLFVTPGNCEA